MTSKILSKWVFVFLMMLIGFFAEGCTSENEITPKMYDHIKMGGSVDVTIITPKDSLIFLSGKASDLGLVISNYGENSDNNSVLNSLMYQLSLKNSSDGELPLRAYFEFKPLFLSGMKNDTAYSLSRFKCGTTVISLPKFYFKSSATSFEYGSSISVSNLGFRNEPTTVSIVLNGPFSVNDSLSMPVKSILIEAKTYLIP
jgi:hypothetical protein